MFTGRFINIKIDPPNNSDLFVNEAAQLHMFI